MTLVGTSKQNNAKGRRMGVPIKSAPNRKNVLQERTKKKYNYTYWTLKKIVA